MDSIINKWKKMKKQFKKEVDKFTSSGTGRREKWRYFDDMQAICGHRDNITPTVLLESSKDNDHSDHSEGESTCDTESCEIDLWSNSTFESGIVDEQQTIEGQSTKVQVDLKDLEKDPGQEGKKALKRDAETLSTSRKPKKTKLEKSLKLLFDSFKEATEMEMKQQQKIEEERHKREMEFQWKLRQLEMKRRRKERQH